MFPQPQRGAGAGRSAASLPPCAIVRFLPLDTSSIDRTGSCDVPRSGDRPEPREDHSQPRSLYLCRISGHDPRLPPDPDDWFAEPSSAASGTTLRGPEAETRESSRDELTPDADDWLEDAPASTPIYGYLASRKFGRREAIAAAVVVAVLLVVAGLALAGVFSSDGNKADTIATTTTHTPTTTPGTTTTPATTPSAKTVPAPTANLKAGDQGAQVKVLQRALAHLGDAPGKIDGIYGPLTQAAVEEFQKASKLVADGIVGPLTRSALAQALRGQRLSAAGAAALDTVTRWW